jgi:hypothetical protein
MRVGTATKRRSSAREGDRHADDEEEGEGDP